MSYRNRKPPDRIRYCPSPGATCSSFSRSPLGWIAGSRRLAARAYRLGRQCRATSRRSSPPTCCSTGLRLVPRPNWNASHWRTDWRPSVSRSADRPCLVVRVDQTGMIIGRSHTPLKSLRMLRERHERHRRDDNSPTKLRNVHGDSWATELERLTNRPVQHRLGKA